MENMNITPEVTKADFDNVKDQLFADYMKYVSTFKRESYAATFEQFGVDKNQAIKCMVEYSRTGDDAKQYIADSLANMSLEMEKTVSRLEKNTFRLNNNLYMVVYVIPTLLGDNYREKDLAEKICSVWSQKIKSGNISPADFQSIKGGFKSKLCYITTAVCKGLGKGENAEEITELKNFRDGYMASCENGERMINDYYDCAPTIVKRIEKSENPELKYLYLWENYIKPCVDAISRGENEACLDTYTAMVDELKDEYMNDRH